MFPTCFPHGLVVHLQFCLAPTQEEVGNGHGHEILFYYFSSDYRLLVIESLWSWLFCPMVCLVVQLWFGPNPGGGGGGGGGRGGMDLVCLLNLFMTSPHTSAILHVLNIENWFIVLIVIVYGLFMHVQFCFHLQPKGNGKWVWSWNFVMLVFLDYSMHVESINSTYSAFCVVAHVQHPRPVELQSQQRLLVIKFYKKCQEILLLFNPQELFNIGYRKKDMWFLYFKKRHCLHMLTRKWNRFPWSKCLYRYNISNNKNKI